MGLSGGLATNGGAGSGGSGGTQAQTPQARAILSANQSITNVTFTAISWAATDFNNGPLWAAGSPTRLTASAAGLYLVECCVEFASASVVANYLAQIRKNGAALPGVSGLDATASATAANTTLQATALLRLALNDFLEVWVYQGSGSPLNVQPGTNNISHFAMAQVSL